jgi:hypothetical protein
MSDRALYVFVLGLSDLAYISYLSGLVDVRLIKDLGGYVAFIVSTELDLSTGDYSATKISGYTNDHTGLYVIL